MKELIKKVENWAKEKGILDNATPIDQFEKTLEEVNELKGNLFKQRDVESSGFVFENDILKDDIGDITVTLIIQCKMQGLDFIECLQEAYDVISKRTGKMVDGKFVKDK